MSNPTTIKIDDVEYVRKDSVSVLAPELDGKQYVIARSRDAGVFAGYLESKDGNEVKLINARRIWKWVGAASLSQLAVDGVSKPNECKFPVAVPFVIMLGVCEILPVNANAKESIDRVPVWRA